MWLKAATCRQLSTVVSELIEGSEYKFRVKAENPYGVSDPSEESDTIFIPDPKRGILQPPPKTDLSEIWLDEVKKRPSEDESEKDGQETKRRKLLEENARKLLDTPLSVLLPRQNTSTTQPLKANRISPSPSPSLSRDVTEQEATKRHFEDFTDENIPPPVPKRKNKGEKRSVTASPDESASLDELRAEDTNNNSKALLSTVASQDVRRNSYPMSTEDSTFLNVPGIYPRENDDSILHGSSELMLVLLPEERAKSMELSE